LQGGADVPAAHVETAGAENIHGRAQRGLRKVHVCSGLLDAHGRHAKVGIVGDRLGHERVELRIVETGEPLVLDTLGSSTGFPRVSEREIRERLPLELLARGRRQDLAAGHENHGTDQDHQTQWCARSSDRCDR
jgi:hypothetical protein